MRDHDVATPEMRVLVSLAHTVFNAATGEAWKSNKHELRRFDSIPAWTARIEAAGLQDTGHRILQDNDPTRNTLLAFTKPTTGEIQ